MEHEEYLEKEFVRAKKNLYRKERTAFGSANDLATWYINKLKEQGFKCFYCETSVFDINKLIDAGLLKTRATRGNGKRGPVLEIDKNDDIYTPERCVLSCYYCNNDKSYTSEMIDYKMHFGSNRNLYFKKLLNQLNSRSN